MKFTDLITLIEKAAPMDLTEPWDNSGVQIAISDDPIKKVLVALEINGKVIEEAKKEKVQLILTHHPLIFYPMKSIDTLGLDPLRPDKTLTSKYIKDLVEAGINVYSAHITFDKAEGGNNHFLGEKIGLRNIYTPSLNPSNMPGIIGTVETPLTLGDFIQDFANNMDMDKDTLKVVGNMKEIVKKVGICTGAGGDFLPIAMMEGCDLLVTGEVKLHQAQLAKEMGIAIIDGGHYGTEKIFQENMTRILKDLTVGSQVEVIDTTVNLDPFVV